MLTMGGHGRMATPVLPRWMMSEVYDRPADAPPMTRTIGEPFRPQYRKSGYFRHRD
jgi:hypothetical protein